MSDDFDILRAEITLDPLARGYSGMSNIAIAASLNTANRPVTIQRALLVPSDIINAIVPADLAALSQLQTTQFSLLLSGSLVDVSVGSAVRAAIRSLFAGKTTTLTQLNALVSKFDSPPAISRAAELGWTHPVSDQDVAGVLR